MSGRGPISMVRAMLLRIRTRLRPLRSKREGELRYWEDRVAIEGALAGGHYEWFFTDHFDLDGDTYVDRSVLDVGCGPRGSLEWADQARLRVGLDPLAWPYRSVGTRSHAMQYVGASSDAMPFQDGHFDVISSFNSLDHVDDLERTTVELVRVLRPGGVLLLLAEVNQPATIVEPITLTWETPSLFPTLEVVRVRRYEMTDSGLFDSVRAGTPFDDADPAPRTGVISVLFRKA